MSSEKRKKKCVAYDDFIVVIAVVVGYSSICVLWISEYACNLVDFVFMKFPALALTISFHLYSPISLSLYCGRTSSICSCTCSYGCVYKHNVCLPYPVIVFQIKLHSKRTRWAWKRSKNSCKNMVENKNKQK